MAPGGKPKIVPNNFGCGYRAMLPSADILPAALVENLSLRNERLELTVNKKSGGIQSVRLHRDRGTRISQRLVFHHEYDSAATESQMVASRVEISRNDVLVGEITSTGRIEDR